MRRLFSTALAILVGCGGVQEEGDDIPAIETVEPPVGPQSGGTEVTVTGSAFDFGSETPTRVAINGAVIEATVVDDATLTFTTPPGDAGAADVVVFHGGGATVGLQAFIYAPLPEVSSIEPELAGEGDVVTIRGRGFESNRAGAVTVSIDGAELTDVQVASDSELTATLPAPPGRPFAFVDVEVTTSNGVASLPQSFRYTKPGLLGILNRREAGKVFYVDPETAQATFFARSNLGFTRATVTPTGEVLVVADSRSAGGTVLGELADDGLTVVNTRPLSTTTAGGDIAVDGDLFVYERSGETLRRYNLGGTELDTATATPVVTRAKCIFRNNSTQLFFIQRLDGALSTLNKSSGGVTAGAALNGPANHGCHGATRIGTDIFIIGVDLDSRDTTLFRLDAANASLTEIGPLEIDDPTVLPRFKAVFPTPPGF